MTKRYTNLDSCRQFLQHLVRVCLAVVSGNLTGVPGGSLGYQLFCGCTCIAPIFTNFHHLYSRLWWGLVYKRPAFGSSLLSLENGMLPYSVFTQNLVCLSFLQDGLIDAGLYHI